MADGYARATGRPSFVNLPVAAGLANGLAAMLNARRSRVPMVVTAGQQDRRHLVDDPVLTGDLVGIAAAASKQAVEVHHARDLPVVLRRAFALAARPPAGPVFVSIPVDLLRADTEVTVPARSALAPLGPATGLDQAAWLLTAAARPAIVAGDGVGRADAVAQLVTLAERLNATVYHAPLHDWVNFPFTHPLHAGMLTPRNDAIRKALSGHDVVLVVGSHAFSPHHYTEGPPIPAGTRVVQLDDDPAELGRTFPVELGLTGDIRASLTLLGTQVRRRPNPARTAKPPTHRISLTTVTAPLDPQVAAQAIAHGLPRDAVVVDEAGTVSAALRPLLHLDTPGSLVHTIGGGLGWGIGAAVGTRMARQDRPVVAVLGDGGALFGLQGLWSAARYRVPVLFLVMSDGEYRTLKDTLAETGAAGPHPGLDLGRMDWLAAGRFFDLEARQVTDDAELRALVSRAGTLTAPVLVEVPILGA
jgi:benzoylformate decarboxylase